MNLLKLLLTLVIAIFITVNFSHAISQTTEKKPSLNESDIEGQFKYLISRSSDFEDYKMVKRWILYSFKSHVIDTLTLLKTELSNTEDIVIHKDRSIDSLKTVIESTNKQVLSLSKEKDSLKMFGIPMHKAVYNNIVLGVVLILIVVLIMFVVMYKRSNILTVKAKADLIDLQEEFVAHRKSSLKRHEKVVRELYDEILKLKQQSSKNQQVP